MNNSNTLTQRQRYLLFMSQFLEQLDQLLESNKNYLQRRMINRIIPLISELIHSTIAEPQFKDLQFDLLYTNDYGTNFRLKNEIGAFEFPLVLLQSANWREALNQCKLYLQNVNADNSWDEIQNQIYKQLVSFRLRSLGTSGRLLEGLRLLLAWFDLDPDSFSFDEPIPQTELLQTIYYPIYSSFRSQSIYNVLKTYFKKSSRKSFSPFFRFVALASPDYWNLDILLIDFQQLKHLPKDQTLAHSPIGFVYDNTDSLLFGLYWIPGKSIRHQNKFHKNLAKRIHFFLNFNHFKEYDTKDIKIVSLNRTNFFPYIYPLEKLKRYTSRSPPPFRSQFEPPNNQQDLLFSPNWELILETSSNSKRPLDRGLLDYRELNLIRFYNARTMHLAEWNQLFINKFPIFHLLFPYRVFVTSTGYTTSYIQVIFFLQVSSKRRIPKIIQFLKLWLIDGIILENFQSIWVLTRIPINMITSEFETKIMEFFRDIDIKCSIFFEDRPDPNLIDKVKFRITPLSYFYLPNSNFFSQENGKWNLSNRKIFMSRHEKNLYINSLLDKEDSKLDLAHFNA